MCDKDVSNDVTCAPDDYTASLMAEVNRLQDENERLQAENADLHEEVADWRKIAHLVFSARVKV